MLVSINDGNILQSQRLKELRSNTTVEAQNFRQQKLTDIIVFDLLKGLHVERVDRSVKFGTNSMLTHSMSTRQQHRTETAETIFSKRLCVKKLCQ